MVTAPQPVLDRPHERRRDHRPARIAASAAPVDALRAALPSRTEAKLEPLKTKGRLIVDFKTPAEGVAALAAVNGLS